MLPGTGLRYVKGHGTENDFVLLPDPDGRLQLTADLVARLCDRRAGLGADGVLRVVLAQHEPDAAHLADEARWFMDYRNADGSVAEMCGNGVRVYARYLVDAGLARPGEHRLATRGGVKAVTVEATGDVTVGMGAYTVGAPTLVDGVEAVSVDMGNPHAVVRVDDLAALGELHPDRLDLNVEYVVVHGPGHLALRVHERGVGETRSCGTGACAAAVAAAAWTATAPGVPWRVDVPGGTLTVVVRGDGTTDLAGPAVLVAEGELRPDWLTAGPTPGPARTPGGPGRSSSQDDTDPPGSPWPGPGPDPARTSRPVEEPA